jgi:hypothetical protein
LSDKVLIAAKEGVVSCELAGGAALLDMESSTYYGVNPVAAHVWNLIQSPTPFATVHRSIQDAFDVGAEQSLTDLKALVDALSSAGLIVVSHAPPA